ncbi:MAG: hypothetical protein KDC04_00600 [Saprospiraceae bacterium]|nr:hypothetical protein [Saprospiraceae bacterium]
MKNTFDHTYKSKLNSLVADTSSQDRDWHALEKRLNKKEKKRHLAYLFTFAAVGIFILCFTTIGIIAYQNDTVKTQKESKKTGNHQPPIAQHQTIPKFHTNLNAIVDQDSNGKCDYKYSKPTNTKNVSSSIIRQKIYTDDASVIGKVVEPSQDNNIITSDTTFSNSVNTSLHLSNFKSTEGTPPPINVVELPSLYKGISYLDSPNLDFNLTQKVSKSSKPSLKFSYGKFYDIFPKIHHADHLNHIEETIIRNSLGMTLQSNLVYSLNDKYRLSIGLSHSSIAFDTYHTMNIKAHELTINEPSINSQRNYTFNYDISDGKTNSSLLVSFFDVTPGQHVSKSDSFDFSMKINKNIKTLSLPLIFERRLLNKHNFNMYIQLGSSLNYGYKINTQIMSSDETCKELCLINGFEPTISSNISSTSLLTVDGLIGLALEYKLSPRFSVGITPQSSIRFNNPDNLKRYELSSYVFYHFNK